MKIVEIPPKNTPTEIGTAKSLICGTKITTETIVNKVVARVPMDLMKDWFKDKVISSLLLKPGWSLRFSLTLSKMTMVSLME